ncbi:putative ribonuclease H-like domain-containing protein, partial [Tanacetum coccineum]
NKNGQGKDLHNTGKERIVNAVFGKKDTKGQGRNRDGNVSKGIVEPGEEIGMEDNAAQNVSSVMEGHDEPSVMINEENVQKDTVSPFGNANTEERTKHTNNEIKQDNNKSFASIIKEQMEKCDNKLDFIPPDINEKGDEVAIFDDELVSEGSKRWKMTMCGYFVGTQMSLYEVRYNVRRMWGRAERFGFARVLVEINAAKECKDSIEVQCNHCKVYGHGLIECKKRPRTKEELKQNKGGRKEVIDRTEFEEVKNKKKGNYIDNLKKKSVELQYRPKVNVKKDILKKNTSETDMGSRNEENVNKVQKEDVNKGHKDDGGKDRNANKYVVLQENYDEEFPPYISPTKQTVVDKYLKYKRKLTKEDAKNGMIIGEFLKENELRNEGNNVLIEGGADGIDQGLGSTSGIRAFALRNFDLEVMEFESAHSNTTAKLPILKLGEYEMWVIRIKQYFQVQDYALWEVIENGNSWVSVPQTTQENALPNEHQLTFSQYNDAKTMFAAIETRFRGSRRLLNPNGSNLLQQDLEQTHEDDLEAIDLKWHLSLLSMRAKRYFQRTGKKIFINANDTAGYDKSKVECFNCHKMGHFVRECREPRNKEVQFRNQDNTRKHGNNEDTSSKAMLAIYGVAATYKRGLATVEEQLVTYRNNEVLFSEDAAVLKREVACKDYEISVLKTEFEKVKQEKEGIDFKIAKFDNASKDLDKLLAINTAKAQAVNTARPKTVKTARPNSAVVNAVRGKPLMDDKGFVDSGCSRHMTGNIAYLSDFKEFDGGYVTFGGGAHGGRISGKGTLKTDSLDFEDVYFVNELKFNLFSVSQMCDKKNYVLFTDTECLVLSPNFKLPDETQILLKIPRKDNMCMCYFEFQPWIFDLQNSMLHVPPENNEFEGEIIPCSDFRLGTSQPCD